ncbi:MAG TPA: hypothetical protein VFS20_21160 [Longimicrobium sp.]|nr:hypothetical protein [Longimicrobium sp.]
MTLKEIEARALKPSPAEHVLLAKRLLAADQPEPSLVDESDPIHNLGKNPVSDGDVENGGEPGTYSIWGLGSNSVAGGVTDGSINYDHYLYGSPKRDACDG